MSDSGPSTPRPRRSIKGLLIGAAGLVAVSATLAGNLDKILDTAAKWLGPYISKYINPSATLTIALEKGLTISPHVFIADPANKTRVIAVADAKEGSSAALTVTADTFYRIGWQGAGLLAGGTDEVLITKGTPQFRLLRDGEVDGQIKLKLRQSEDSDHILTAAEPSAKLLLSAQAASAATPFASNALPELDRAVAVVGLFETGTTDCARKLLYIADVPAVGCLGASIPGWLADVVTALDKGDARRLDALVGDNAEPLRVYLRAPRRLPPEAGPRKAMTQLIASPEFWIQYQSRVIASYQEAADAARQLKLVSERGRLLVFDILVQAGPPYLTRTIARFAAAPPDGSTTQPADEKARLRAVGEFFKTSAPTHAASASRMWSRRIDTIVGGRGSIRGIAFDLEQLGISDAGPPSRPPLS